MCEVDRLLIISVIWILSFNLARSHKLSTCTMEIENCEYRLSLLPSSSCQNDNYLGSRLKRSTVLKEGELQFTAAEINSLSKKFKRLERKLIKEMQQLSTRVLRGTRKLEFLSEDRLESHINQRRKCPDGFITHNDWESCYLFSTFNTSWYTARDFCTALDSELVALGSLKEHFLVAFMIKNNGDYRYQKGWWTSGTYVTKTKDWMWTSSTELQPFTFIKWAVNEPNEKHDQELQCVMMYELDDLKWHDQICTDNYNFVCEKKLKLSERP